MTPKKRIFQTPEEHSTKAPPDSSEIAQGYWTGMKRKRAKFYGPGEPQMSSELDSSGECNREIAQRSPISLSALENDWPLFVKAVESRLQNGMQVYGDTSFSRSILDLSHEVEAELLDLVGWGFILWKRHKDLMNLIASKSEE